MGKVKSCVRCGKVFGQPGDKVGLRKYCSLECALWARVQVSDPASCWPWTGYIDVHGYGAFSFNGQTMIKAGSRSDNIRECWAKGRGVLPPWVGRQQSGAPKMKRATARSIYESFKVGIKPSDLAAQHGVSERAIHQICHRARKKLGESHDGRFYRSDRVRLVGSAHPLAKLDESKVAEIRRRHAAGDRIVDIATAIGCLESTVQAVVKRKSWKHVA